MTSQIGNKRFKGTAHHRLCLIIVTAHHRLCLIIVTLLYNESLKHQDECVKTWCRLTLPENCVPNQGGLLDDVDVILRFKDDSRMRCQQTSILAVW